jgi:hypothetical protein
MKTRVLSLVVGCAIAVGCGSGSSTGPSGDPTPSVLPSPDLSAPQRFRPFIDELVAAPTAIRVGETAVLTGSVRSRSGMPSPEISWLLFAEPVSVGNGVLTALFGSGDIRSEFQANYKGEVTFVAYAVDSNGVPSMPTRTVLTVVE